MRPAILVVLPAALSMGALVGIEPSIVPSRPQPSSHREAPQITELPKVDATDFYLFRSYEANQDDMVVLIANYQPLQAAYGGPNYFTMDPDALYEIHVDNNGDALEDITFQFRFQNRLQDFQLPIGVGPNQKQVSIPLIQKGGIAAGNDANLNLKESYTLNVVFGDRRNGTVVPVSATGGGTTFTKPVDNVGNKTLADYQAYADQYVYGISLPGGAQGRVFVGQRKDPFVVNLGETFDLVNDNPLGPVDGESDDLADANVTSLILEIPISFLTDTSPIIGGWTSASMRQARVVDPTPNFDAASGATLATLEGGAWTQVSRLGMPLVNEVVIGIKHKDLFNASEPKDDVQFLDYVTHPTLPALLEALFPVTAPTAIPRNDLVQVFLTGVPGLNETTTPCEMVRLNTSIAPVPKGSQSNLGVLGGDLAGFPNGRRPGDDVVDMALRVVMGVLLPIGDAPSGQLPFTDGAKVDDSFFQAAFPFLNSPLAGSPN
jgi:hypothetical protein